MKQNKQLTPTSQKQTEATAGAIKLGIDIHYQSLHHRCAIQLVTRFYIK